MVDQNTFYPNLSWAQFEMYNDNRTEAFEEMCKDLFTCEYLKDSCNPHSDHNNPGVEVLPVLEPPRSDGQTQKRISYQAKYFKKLINDTQITNSLQQSVNHYAGKLDVIYLFCNIVISKNSNRYEKYSQILQPANIKLELVTDKDIFVLIRKYRHAAEYYFQDRTRSLKSTNVLINARSIGSSVSKVEPMAIEKLVANNAKDIPHWDCYRY